MITENTGGLHALYQLRRPVGFGKVLPIKVQLLRFGGCEAGCLYYACVDIDMHSLYIGTIHSNGLMIKHGNLLKQQMKDADK
jgi:hypothetical protein